MISTRNLTLLPDAARLKALLQSMALLDAIFQPEWSFRLHSFNSRWDAGEQMGSMRDGQGDDFFALFNAAGCWLKGFAHESPMTPYRAEPKRVWPGVLESVPAEFKDCLGQRAFSVADTTFCVWWLDRDPGWQRGRIEFPPGHPDPDGSGALLARLDGRPETYHAFARGYFSRAKGLAVEAVRHMYKHRPIDEEFVRRLNPEMSFSDLAEDIREIGYPAVGGPDAEPGAAADGPRL